MESGVREDWAAALALSPASRTAAVEAAALGGHPSRVAFLHRPACLFGAWRRRWNLPSVTQIQRCETCPAGKGKTGFQAEGAEAQLASTVMGT